VRCGYESKNKKYNGFGHRFRYQILSPQAATEASASDALLSLSR
jgi:hypothetical protein